MAACAADFYASSDFKNFQSILFAKLVHPTLALSYVIRSGIPQRVKKTKKKKKNPYSASEKQSQEKGRILFFFGGGGMWREEKGKEMKKINFGGLKKKILLWGSGYFPRKASLYTKYLYSWFCRKIMNFH